MQNSSFFSSPLLEEAANEFVEAHIIATEYYDLKPPEAAAQDKEKPPATTEVTTQPEGSEFVWQFQINPSSLRHALGAQYADSQTWAAVTPDSQFFTAQAETMEIQNAIFDTWQKGKSLDGVLRELKRMIQPAPKKGMFHPPILTFVWGTMTFGPCILTSLSWEEVAWLGGAPATAQVTMSLKRVPEEFEEQADNNPLLVPANTDSDATVNTTDGASPALPLTDNQRKQASEYARAHLLLNRENFSPEVQQALRANAYLLLTDAKTGEVKMLKPDGTVIGTIFRWNGSSSSADAQFTVEGVSTVPVAQGRTPSQQSISTLEGVATLIRQGNYNPYATQIPTEETGASALPGGNPSGM